MANLIRVCKSHGGSCLADFPDIIEEAAVEAAIKGRLEIVELLIDYAKSIDLILSAAIRSDNSNLIRYILGRKPNLNPPARCLRPMVAADLHEDASRFLSDAILTTPLAEAIRTDNGDLIRLLEAENPAAFTSRTNHGDLEAAYLGAVEAGNISCLRRLLSIAASTKVKFQIPTVALELALEQGHEEASHLLIEQGTRGSRSRALAVALRKRNPTMVAAILATDILNGPDIAKAVLEWGQPSVLESVLFVMPDMKMRCTSHQTTAFSYSNNVLEQFCLRCMKTNSLDIFRLFVESTTGSNHNMDDCLAVAIRKGHCTMAL